MIKVDVGKVVTKNLNEGETLEGEGYKLKLLALNHMWSDRYGKRGLYARIKASEDMIKQCDEIVRRATFTFSELHAVLKRDPEVWGLYYDVRRFHFISFSGEIAMHHMLGKDWHLVYEFNRLGVGHQPDGFIGSQTYDLKTRDRNKWGLPVYNEVLRDDYYVLAHYYENHVYLIGYSTREELMPTRAHSKFNNYWMPTRKMHPIEYFKPEFLHSGLSVYLGFKEPKITRILP